MPSETITPAHVAYGDLKITNDLQNGPLKNKLNNINNEPSSKKKNTDLLGFLIENNYLPCTEGPNNTYVVNPKPASYHEYKKFDGDHCIQSNFGFSIRLSGCHHAQTREFFLKTPFYLKKDEIPGGRPYNFYVSKIVNGITCEKLKLIAEELSGSEFQDGIASNSAKVPGVRVLKIPITINYGNRTNNCYLIRNGTKKKFGFIYANNKTNGYPVSVKFLKDKISDTHIKNCIDEEYLES